MAMRPHQLLQAPELDQIRVQSPATQSAVFLLVLLVDSPAERAPVLITEQ